MVTNGKPKPKQPRVRLVSSKSEILKDKLDIKVAGRDLHCNCSNPGTGSTSCLKTRSVTILILDNSRTSRYRIRTPRRRIHLPCTESTIERPRTSPPPHLPSPAIAAIDPVSNSLHNRASSFATKATRWEQDEDSEERDVTPSQSSPCLEAKRGIGPVRVRPSCGVPLVGRAAEGQHLRAPS
ncbi:hypothetical protein Droror1_Dr00026171 [Drosera rotundifolia]